MHQKTLWSLVPPGVHGELTFAQLHLVRLVFLEWWKIPPCYCRNTPLFQVLVLILQQVKCVGCLQIVLFYFHGTHSGLKKHISFNGRKQEDQFRKIKNYWSGSFKTVKKAPRPAAGLIPKGFFFFFLALKILTGTQFDSSNGRQTFTVLVKENWPADSVHVYWVQLSYGAL